MYCKFFCQKESFTYLLTYLLPYLLTYLYSKFKIHVESGGLYSQICGDINRLQNKWKCTKKVKKTLSASHE